MRLRKSSCARLLVLLVLVLLFYFHLPPNQPLDDSPKQVSGRKMAEEKEEAPEEKASIGEPPGPGEESLAGLRVHGLPNTTRDEEKEQIKSKVLDIQMILANIEKENNEQAVRNVDIFGAVTNSTVVILVQVHNRVIYLRQLVASLKLARGIQDTLLVFSHDVWDPEINALVRSISFARVVQMFYPFSLQTHPHSFPGESTNDCPRDSKPDKARSMKCTNSQWPDIHGHYREAKFTQTKHHWWWKTNRLFHGLAVTRHFAGSVVFLEEDHYVAADFLHVLALMNTQKQQLKEKQKVDVLSLGTYLKRFNFKVNTKQVEVTEWISSKHNMGMVVTREQWGRVLECSRQFCQYDDYNWDWSLQHISNSCFKEKLQVMMVKGPRVFHIGECGVHHKKADCDSAAALDKVHSIINSAAAYFYPEKLTVVKAVVRKKVKLKKGNGGWGDRRDHQLCTNMTLAPP